MFNEADFVISILNSENEKVKENVKEMCKLTSTDQLTNINYDLYNNQVNINNLRSMCVLFMSNVFICNISGSM